MGGARDGPRGDRRHGGRAGTVDGEERWGTVTEGSTVGVTTVAG